MEEPKRELTLTRELPVSREAAFKAWTDQAEVRQWWGPRGVTNPVCEVNPVPGGLINIVMEAGESLGELSGKRWPMSGEFEEVLSPKRLVFVARALQDDKPIPTTRDTVTFDDLNGKTNMTVKIEVTATTPEAEGPLSGMEQGWKQSLDRLSEYLEKII